MTTSPIDPDKKLLAACSRSEIWLSQLKSIDAQMKCLPRRITPDSEELEEEAGAVGDLWFRSLHKVFATPARTENGSCAKKKVLSTALRCIFRSLPDIPDADIAEHAAWSLILDISLSS